MPAHIVCTRAIIGGSFSSEPGPPRFLKVLKPSNIKRIGVAPRAGRVGLPESAPAKAVGVDCGARFLKTHPTTNPVVDPISHSWSFDDPALLKDLPFTIAEEITKLYPYLFFQRPHHIDLRSQQRHSRIQDR